jgi:hypothetical protein
MNPTVDAKNTIYIGYGPASLTVTANASGGTAPYAYSWDNGQMTQSISVTAAGTYTAAVTDSKGCSTTASIIINILDVHCGNNGDKVMICHNNNTICVASSAVQEHLDHGDYLGGCSTYTTVREANNASQWQVTNRVIIYPSPAHENITVKVSELQSGATVVVYNANGQIVLNDRMTNNAKTISVKSLASGVYYVQVRNCREVITRKVVKQ